MNYYDHHVLNYINHDLQTSQDFAEWYKIVHNILIHPEFQKRKLFMHHHNKTVWDHSILVSFKSFILGKSLKADFQICAIAGLLHDFYSQSWLSTPELEKLENGRYTTLLKESKPWYKKHAFTHGADATQNYHKYFPELINKKIDDAITNHMFPLTLTPPHYKESIIISIVDKINSFKELPSFTTLSKKIIFNTYHYLHNKI